MRKSTSPDNESRCCDAAIRALEDRLGETRSGLSFPEQTGHAAPVEVVCTIAGRQFAIEHTKLETYRGQIADGDRFSRVMEPIEAALKPAVPVWAMGWLVVPLGAFDGLPAKRLSAIGTEIREWAQQRLDSLPRDHAEERTFREVVQGITVVLSAWPGPKGFPGTLKVARQAPRDVDPEQDDQVCASLERKLPKLAKWAATGAETVLVLELADLALTNAAKVHMALQKCLASRTDVPAHLFIVDTTNAVQWAVHHAVDARVFSDLRRLGDWTAYMDPTELNETLTARR